MLPFDLRYGIIPYSEFSEYVLVDNVDYGKRIDTNIGLFGSRPVTPDINRKRILEESCSFYTKLEESILAEGFLNPIFGFNFSSGLFAKIGTSRLYLAVKHKLDLPSIVADYTGRWKHLEQLKSISDVESKFTHPPKVIDVDFKKHRPIIQYGFHHHLGEHRWEDMKEVRIWYEG